MWVDLNAFFLYDTIEKPKSTFKTKPKPLPFKKKGGGGDCVVYDSEVLYFCSWFLVLYQYTEAITTQGQAPEDVSMESSPICLNKWSSLLESE